MSYFAVPYTFQDLTTFDAEQVNADFTALIQGLNSLQTQINTITQGPGVNALQGLTGKLQVVSPNGSILVGTNPTANYLTLMAVASGTPGYFMSTMVPGQSAALNTTALQNDINNVQAAGGGTLVLPNGVCQIAGTVYIGPASPAAGVYIPIHIVGIHNASTIQQTIAADVFQVNINSGANVDAPGMSFENFYILGTTGLTSGAGIRILSGQHVKIDSMTIYDMPQNIAVDNALQTYIVNCLLGYKNNTSISGSAMLTIGTSQGGGVQANETVVFATTLITSAINAGGVGGDGIAIYSVNHVRLQNLRVEGFVQGVKVIPGTAGHNTQYLHFENVNCYTGSSSAGTGAGFLFKPGIGYTIYEVAMINCTTTPGVSSGTAYTGAGIVFDTSAGSGTTIDAVRLVGCYSAGWTGPGMQLTAGAGTLGNVSIVNGAYICNGQEGTSGPAGSGIYIHGAANGVYIDGARLDNNSSAFSATQTYAIAFDQGATNIWARGCAMAGLVTAPVYASGQGAHVGVINCPGYNTINTLLAAGSAACPATTVQFDGTTVGATPYFGPILVIWGGGTVSNTKVSQDRAASGTSLHNINQAGGILPLVCGQSMEIDYSGVPTTFVVLGQ